MITVRATREGLPGGKTSSGYIIESVVPFVALPDRAALYLWIVVTNPLNGKSIRALVLDVGPWNVADHAYVFGGARPAAESGQDVSRNGHTNGAGIDLGGRVWDYLGMLDNGNVCWGFA
jgi:hypothetical protein